MSIQTLKQHHISSSAHSSLSCWALSKLKSFLQELGSPERGVVSEGLVTRDPYKQMSERELLICQALGVRRLRFLLC